MNKQQLESFCRNAGLTSLHRKTVEEIEVLVADGKLSAPAMERLEELGASLEDFPAGCFATFWFAMRDESRHALGRPLFFKPNHASQEARVEAAYQDAREHLLRHKPVIMNAH